MNFNIASPSNNGNEFTIQFKEHISIPEKSTISLNFAELVRDKAVILKEDGLVTMTIDPADMIPTAPPSAPTAQNLAFNTQTGSTKSVTIAQGTYTFSSFRTAVQNTIGTLLLNSNLFGTRTEYSNQSDNEAELVIGIIPDQVVADNGINNNPLEEFVSDGTNELNNTTDNGVVYTSNTPSAAYDNYGLSAKHFYHYIDNASLGVAKTPEENEDITQNNNAYMYIESVKTIAEQNGKGNLWVGLYSSEYAAGITGTPPAPRTTAGTIHLAGGKPSCFVGFELAGDGSGIKVYYAEDTSATPVPVTKWTNINKPIGNMKRVATIPITQFVMTDKWKLIVGTEIDNSSDEPSIRIKVGSYQDGVFKLVWDSKKTRRNLPYALMVGDLDYATAGVNGLNSQIPFNIMTSMNVSEAGHGFARLDYKEWDKTTDYDNANPASLAKKISLSFSDELSRAVGVTSPVVIRPNQYTPANPDQIAIDLDYTWKKNNYSIMLDLPLNNYKNKSASANTRDNGGVKKQVLANIPAAFNSGEVVETLQPALSAGEVLTVYQPYQPIVSKMLNNEMEINSLTFQIVDMLTEEKATEISRSVINFTIN